MYNSHFLRQNQNILLRNYPNVLHWLCISATFENNFRSPHGDVAWLILRSIDHFNVVYVAGAQAEPEYCANMHRYWIKQYSRRVTQEVWNDTECSWNQAKHHSSITYLAFAEGLWNWLLIYCVWCITHWGRVTHICVSKLTIIGSDNGLSPDRRQTIIWTNAGLLLIGP